MDIFKKLQELNFPLGEYVVPGGAMAAHGIRDAHDLDVLVTPRLYNKLVDEGWTKCLCAQCIKTNRIMLKKDNVDILPDYTYGKYIGDVDWLIKNADMIRGYPFMNLIEFMKFKRELARPKDFVDIELMEAYVKKTDYVQKTPLHIA